MSDERCPKCGAEHFQTTETNGVFFECGSNLKDGELHQEHSCKIRELTSLRADNARLQGEVERLTESRDGLRSYNVDLQVENESLRTEVERLRGVVEAAREALQAVADDDETGEAQLRARAADLVAQALAALEVGK